MKNLMDKIKLPTDRFEIRLSGSGGQGMILKSPSGLVCRLLTIDNLGMLITTSIECPK